MAISKDEYKRRERLMNSIEYGLEQVANKSKGSDVAKYSTFVAVDQYIDERHKSYETDIREQLEKLAHNDQSVNNTLGNIMNILDNDYEMKNQD